MRTSESKPARGPRFRHALPNALVIVFALVLAGGAGAQVTNTTDMDPPEEGSLRFEVEGASAGATIDFELGEGSEIESQISLRETLPFDQDVILDNRNPDFGPTEIKAPNSGTFLLIEDDVSVTLRDVDLSGDSNNNDDDVELETATSELIVDLRRSGQIFDTDIVGAGVLIKEGSEALTLSGNNSFSGGIVVEEGDVVGDLNALASPGMGDIDLQSDGSNTTARIVFDITGNPGVLDLANPAILDSSPNTGDAVFVKAGSSSLDISAAAIDSTIELRAEGGTLTIGTVKIGQDFELEVDSGATIRLDHAVDVTHAGKISGDGTLEDAGGLLNTATLVGDLTDFTGDIEIQSGELRIDPAVAPTGSLRFSAETRLLGNLRVVDDFGVELTGDISGNGAFFKSGDGTTRLSGRATHTEGTSVCTSSGFAACTGTLIGNTNNLQGDIIIGDGATLVFDQDFDGDFDGRIGFDSLATNRVEKLGTGTLSLVNPVEFSGDFFVLEGGLHMGSGSSIDRANLILGDGDLSGIVDLSADFDPGQLPAGNTFQIGGDLVVDDDGRILVDIDDGNATIGNTVTNTVFDVAGSITLGTTANPELSVRIQPGDYLGSPTFDILTSGGGITGDFDIVQDLFFFDILGAIVGNDYRITLSPNANSLEAAGNTHNQREVGRALDDIRLGGSGGDPAIQEILDALNTLDAEDVPKTLDGFSADDLLAAVNVRLAVAARTWRGLSNRLALERGRSIGHHGIGEARARRARRARSDRAERNRARRERRRRPVDAGPPEMAAPDPTPWVAWFEGRGGIGELQSSDSQTYDYKLVGPLLGADAFLTEQVRVGFATAGTRYLYDSQGRNNKGVSNAFEATAYGIWASPLVDALVGFRYGHSWVDTDRIIKIENVQDRAEGDYDGDEFGVYAELTRAFDLPAPVKMTLAPVANIAYSHIRYDDINESSSSALRMQVDGDGIDSARTMLGFRFAAESEMDNDLVIRPRIRAGWSHEWADQSREISGQFAAGGGNLDLEGAEVPRDIGEFSVGWEIAYARSANLFIDWDGRFGEDLVENSLSFGVRAAW